MTIRWEDEWRREAQHVASRTRPARWDPAHTELIRTRIAVHQRMREQRVAAAIRDLERLASRVVAQVDRGELTRQEAARMIVQAANRPDPATPVLMRLIPWRETVRILRRVRAEHRSNQHG